MAKDKELKDLFLFRREENFVSPQNGQGCTIGEAEGRL